jgi:hypothetical protein
MLHELALRAVLDSNVRFRDPLEPVGCPRPAYAETLFQFVAISERQELSKRVQAEIIALSTG